MKTRKLGSSGLDVPIICLGTMTWGQQNTEVEAHTQLDYAVNERGVTFIDTAEIYPIPPTSELQGLTETFMGSWLKKRGKREELIIASKVSASTMLGTRDAGQKPVYNKKSIREAIHGSLQRLQTDYLDLYQVHWPERSTNFFGKRGYTEASKDNATPILETLQALGELVQDGLVKHIGVSNETPWGVMEYLRQAEKHTLPRITSIQNQYSLTNRTFEVGLSEVAIKEDVGLLAYSVLNMGVLSGKYLDGAKPARARFTVFGRNEERYNPLHAQEAIAEYVTLAKDHNLDPSQMAIAFALSREFVTSVIIGATTQDQLKLAIDSSELLLPAEVMAGIESIYQRFPDVTC